jgi:hypothetical protein
MKKNKYGVQNMKNYKMCNIKLSSLRKKKFQEVIHYPSYFHELLLKSVEKLDSSINNMSYHRYSLLIKILVNKIFKIIIYDQSWLQYSLFIILIAS